MVTLSGYLWGSFELIKFTLVHLRLGVSFDSVFNVIWLKEHQKKSNLVVKDQHIRIRQ